MQSNAQASNVVDASAFVKVAEHAKAFRRFLARHMNFLECCSDKFTLTGRFDLNINVDDIFVTTFNKVVKPFPIGSVIAAVRRKRAPCRGRC